MKAFQTLYCLPLLVVAWSLSGCNSFLDIESNTYVTGDNFYQSEDDFKAATAPLYNKVWFDFNDKAYYAVGDGRSYNLYAPYSDYIYPFSNLQETGQTGAVIAAWASLYTVVQQANHVIIGITGSSVSDDKKQPYIAEARFMRGVAYWYLASLWGNVIICEDPQILVSSPVVNTHPRKDVFEFAIRDLEYAAKYLPETAGQAGRLTRYSAYGMLSRVYLSYSGIVDGDNPDKNLRNAEYLELAKKAAWEVIDKSKYALMGSYEDLFKIENNNNVESLFALQWVPNGDWGVKNTQQAYFACSSEITGDASGWGGWTYASVDVIREYEAGDLRRKATWMGYGDVYPEISKATGGYTYELNQDALNVKKGVVGSTKDNPAVNFMGSGLNTYMLRLAEVYLTYAEAVLGDNASTTDATALRYVNELRQRAGLSAKSSLSFDDIRHERRIELCMEGQYWYDLVRRAYYKQQDMIEYIGNVQSRSTVEPFLFSNGVLTYPDPAGNTQTWDISPVTADVFVLPYPESEVIQNPKLKEPPVAYTFNEERITDLFN
jgi:hypothetical protein